MPRWLRTFLLLSVVALIAILVLRFLRPTDVSTTVATTGQATEIVYATGTIELEDRVLLRANPGGTVNEVLVKEGDVVKAGQIIAKLSNPRVEADLRKARSQVKVAKRHVKKEGGGESGSTAAVRAELTQAKLEAASTQKLVDEGTLASIEGARAHTKVEVLANKLSAMSGTNPGGRADAKENVEQHDADLSAIEAAFERLSIKAPFDAVILESKLKTADVATDGQHAFTIAKAGTHVVNLTVDEVAMGRVQARAGSTAGSIVKIAVYALDRRVIDGEVIEVSPEVDRDRRTFRAKVRALGMNTDLRSGMTAEANIVVREHVGTLVPSEAVDNDFVWVVTDSKQPAILGQKVERRKVTIGIRDLAKVEILSGLHAGEKIVLHSQKPLREGARVYLR